MLTNCAESDKKPVRIALFWENLNNQAAPLKQRPGHRCNLIETIRISTLPLSGASFDIVRKLLFILLATLVKDSQNFNFQFQFVSGIVNNKWKLTR